jgi:hypothetical protein
VQRSSLGESIFTENDTYMVGKRATSTPSISGYAPMAGCTAATPASAERRFAIDGHGQRFEQ